MKTINPPLESIGRAMSSNEQRFYYTHNVDFVEPHEAEEFARIGKLEKRGYSLIGLKFDETSDLTRDIVIPGERVLTFSEIKELQNKFPWNGKDKFNSIIYDAYIYSLLTK